MLVNNVRKIFGDKDEFANHSDIQLAVESSLKAGHLSSEEASIIDKILALKDLPIAKIMIHHSQVKVVYPTDTTNNAITLGTKYGISRLPVYDKKKDLIVGIFNVNKAISNNQMGFVKQYMTPPHFIPKIKASEMMLEMVLDDKDELFIVINEFGSFSGIISLRQILDYIIQSTIKVNKEDNEGIRYANHGVYINSEVKLEIVENILNCTFPKGDYHTIGGYLITSISSIPRTNEWLVVNGMKFYIDEAKPNRIIRVFINQKGAKQ